MIFGEIFYGSGDIEMNVVVFFCLQMWIINVGDCLVQVGSYVYFLQVNWVLLFDCVMVYGYCLDILVVIVVCFELGIF